MTFKLSSPDFQHEAEMPRDLTCQGNDRSPELVWTGVPEGTKSFVLIVDDPDAPDPQHPKTTWVHWVVFNLPGNVTSLSRGVKSLPPGTKEALNDFKQRSYGGPCPPIGRHRYFFKMYALDALLPEAAEANKATVEAAMKSHVLANATLMGTYQKR
jgi:Raf kinase inhibitor-like YbhB/YbcL family protein